MIWKTMRKNIVRRRKYGWTILMNICLKTILYQREAWGKCAISYLQVFIVKIKSNCEPKTERFGFFLVGRADHETYDTMTAMTHVLNVIFMGIYYHRKMCHCCHIGRYAYMCIRMMSIFMVLFCFFYNRTASFRLQI